ncbi:MAG TPA: TonB-dependent receptor [Gemmatimonadaceae bacterium]|nr:TonB-dependent receptor [Gemmatimonadaceae bacterium]
MPRPSSALVAFCLTLLALTPLGAQGTIAGSVRAAGRPVPYAQVTLRDTRFGAVADSLGQYVITGADAGSHTLLARAIGHAPAERQVTVRDGARTIAHVELRPTAGTLTAVVTTGTLKETYVEDSPVKVAVLTPRFLERNVTANLMDNLPFVNGLAQQVDCGVCFTNSIRINGMEGPYTQVLIDGAPVMSALATVYGFNGIDPSLIQQVEIVKGPQSTLYGSEAMGGVINVVTKDPRFAPRLSTTAFVTSHGETSLTMGMAPPVGERVSAILSGSLAHNRTFVDANADGFSDLPLTTRAALFAKGALDAADGARRLDLAARYYHERRFGGQRGWSWSDRDGTRAYGESILTNRVELLGAWRLPGERRPLRLDFAGNWHDQNSVYGTQPYLATQTTAFAQLVWNPLTTALGDGRHDVLLGATVRHQTYRDSTAFQRTRDDRVVAGIFAQDEVTLAPRWTLLGGMRLDHHPVHGVVTAPRLALKWEADPHTTVRLNTATGFRVVNVFTEDHAALTGARQVVFAEALEPERSLNATASVARVMDVGGVEDAMTLDADVFWTRFTNRILPDFNVDPRIIEYRNLDGTAETRGVSLAVGYATLQKPFFGNLGVTLQRATVTEVGARRRVPFSPGAQVVWTLGYKLAAVGLALDWSGRVQSPVHLPAFEGLADRSPWLTEQHVQATHTLRTGVELFAAVKNVFGTVQDDPLVDAANPFGDRFDTARVYGPTQGRRVLLGGRWVVGR